ncbi:MAG: (cytosine-5)-methyltransferase 1 [Actinomycetota bacterium]|nr:(cytosine-5)-methyltransferase 1 [Actinomycetota bacterium]
MAARESNSGHVQPSRRVAELFAGVGGFRLGLEGLNNPRWPGWDGSEGAGWNVVWSNQWEPGTKTQHASDCYMRNFGDEGHDCADIAEVVRSAQKGEREIPDFDLLVGGFPCQDYSVAKVLSQAAGIQGTKGALWWEIYKLLELKRPSYVILENVDRLLKSPAQQRGRDFAVILWCLHSLGYFVEWRVVNAADYGFPQRRRRVFIVAQKVETSEMTEPHGWLTSDGVLARALPVQPQLASTIFRLDDYIPRRVKLVQSELAALSESFGVGDTKSRFLTAGVMWKGEVHTLQAQPIKEPATPLGEILLPVNQVPKQFFIPQEQMERWTYLKGSKKEPRNGRDGFTYFYNEGPVAFPEPLDQPSRTILTGEGGVSPSRFKHVVKQGRRYRRLTPVELERLNGFPDGWTEGMPDARRAFMMGNALVVGLVNRIGKAMAGAR